MISFFMIVRTKSRESRKDTIAIECLGGQTHHVTHRSCGPVGGRGEGRGRENMTDLVASRVHRLLLSAVDQRIMFMEPADAA